MHFSEVRDMLNRQHGTDFRTLEEVKRAGYRVVRGRDGRYFLAKPEELKSLLVRLGDIAEVRRGFTTGANEFFYLEPLDYRPVCPLCKVSHEEASLLPIKNGAGWEGYLEAEFLEPVIKSPREIKTISVRPEDLHYRVFMCHKSKRKLRRDGEIHTLEYIARGEKQNYHKRPTCSGRPRWWDLGIWDYPTLFWSDAYNNRYLIGKNVGDFYGDKRFFFVNFSGDCLLLNAYLNSTITPLSIELQGIANLGQGVIYTNVYWLKTYLVLVDQNFLTFPQCRCLLSAFKRMSNREIKNIFEELGLPRPNRDYSNINLTDVSSDKVLPDRRELDKVVFEVLGLTEEEQLEVYRAVVELVKNRLVKARSV